MKILPLLRAMLDKDQQTSYKNLFGQKKTLIDISRNQNILHQQLDVTKLYCQKILHKLLTS